MLLRRAVGLGLLAVASLALAQSDVQKPRAHVAGELARVDEGPTLFEVEVGEEGPAFLGDFGQELLEQLPEMLAQRDALRDRLIAAQGGRPGELRARNPIRKTPSAQLSIPQRSDGRFIVKFLDSAGVSVEPDGSLVSDAGADLTRVQQIIERHGLSVSPAIKLTKAKMAGIEARAAALSLWEQPKLMSLVYFEREGGVPLGVAQQLNDLAITEFGTYQQDLVPQYQQERSLQRVRPDPGGVPTAAGAATVACCLPSNFECFDISLGECTAAGGIPWDTFCPSGGQCGACCLDDGDDCIDNMPPSTCLGMDGVFIAGEPCDDGDGNTPCDIDCGNPFTGSCFAPNDNPFCNDELCCTMVCVFDPFCCDGEEWPGRGANHWDEWCCDHALELCPGGSQPPPPGGSAWVDSPTPNFTPGQGYLTPFGYLTDFGEIPASIRQSLKYQMEAGYPFFLDGFSGEGYWLQGMWEIGEFLKNNGIGEVNRSRGLGNKIGVIEHAAYLPNSIGPDAPYGHEELASKTIQEEGQTIIVFPYAPGGPSHGTATLGIIGGLDNDQAGNVRGPGFSPRDSREDQQGIVGMAPEAELYFFPIISVQEGGRLFSAFANALEIFGPGDVLSFSIGPAGCGTLASDSAMWLMLRLASDLGITSCISAGNDCCDLQANPQAGDGVRIDCGAVIVGGTFPGCDRFDGSRPPGSPPTAFNCWCRWAPSNYCTACGVADAVHIGGWGRAVLTLGYGNLYSGPSNNDWNRSYTNTFGGTSAAAPMVASIAVGLQGIAKQFFGIPLMPEQIRTVLAGPTGWINQCNPLLTPPGRTVTDDGPCPFGDSSGDWNRGAGSNKIGWSGNNALTNPFSAAISVVTGGWFDGNPLLTGEIEILRGRRILGNSFSIRASDNNYLVIESQYTVPGQQPDSHLAPIDPVYTGFGQITDIIVAAQADIPNVNALLVVVESHVSNGTGLFLVELFDWDNNFWSFTGLGFLGPVDLGFGFPMALEADRFVRDSDNRVLIRVWTLALGGNGGIGGVPGDQYRVFHDLIFLDVGVSFADIEGPP